MPDGGEGGNGADAPAQAHPHHAAEARWRRARPWLVLAGGVAYGLGYAVGAQFLPHGTAYGEEALAFWAGPAAVAVALAAFQAGGVPVGRHLLAAVALAALGVVAVFLAFIAYVASMVPVHG